jgi:3-phosphoshikimate 1-carboxyvinyltransferase
MHQRPQSSLFRALRELGYRVETPNDRLPAVIFGSGPRPGKCIVSIEESSQFASGLLLCARAGHWTVEVMGDNSEESAYLTMTAKLIEAFPKQGGRFSIEPDASSGSYFLGAELLLPADEPSESAEQSGIGSGAGAASRVSVVNWPSSGWQIDEKFPQALNFGLDADLMSDIERKARAGQALTRDDLSKLERKMQEKKIISRKRDLGDSIMTAIVLAPFASRAVQFTDLGRLRLQECERVLALHTELTRCGAQVIEQGDTLTVLPSKLHGAEVESYDDHRMAMCFAILGLKVPGIKIKNPSCVKKTFPDFFQKMAGGPPRGLGVNILDARDGRNLMASELFAE